MFPPSNLCAMAHRRDVPQPHASSSIVVLVVPLTTTRAAMRFAGTTLIRPTPENGLQQTPVALVFLLWAIDRRCVQECIGSVSAAVLHEILAELDKLTGRTET
jgi:mRNA interferase MazF